MGVSVFQEYWERVERSLGGRPSKSLAIAIEEVLPRFNGERILPELYKTFDQSHWINPYADGDNWRWRDPDERIHSTESKEVLLERAVVRLDPASWTFQLSTASGLIGRHADKRRAIDLVKRITDQHFAFVELKVDADNPIYAAFELIGYYLAYLHARDTPRDPPRKGTGRHDVMRATRIDLVVLAPSKWYRYKTRRGEQGTFSLDGFLYELNAGLGTLGGNTRSSLTYSEFEGRSAAECAEAIHRTGLAPITWSAVAS